VEVGSEWFNKEKVQFIEEEVLLGKILFKSDLGNSADRNTILEAVTKGKEICSGYNFDVKIGKYLKKLEIIFYTRDGQETSRNLAEMFSYEILRKYHEKAFS
jgi:hypothetical protein